MLRRRVRNRTVRCAAALRKANVLMGSRYFDTPPQTKRVEKTKLSLLMVLRDHVVEKNSLLMLLEMLHSRAAGSVTGRLGVSILHK